MKKKIWKQLGTENNATWNTDKKGLPITFGGLNATARDFAKLGPLYLHNGYWNGKQIISTDWINASVSKDSMSKYAGYRNQFWGNSEYETFADSLTAVSKANNAKVIGYTDKKSGNKSYYFSKYTSRYQAEGILGQFVYVIPEKNIIIVRLGHYWKHPRYYTESFMDKVWRMY